MASCVEGPKIASLSCGKSAFLVVLLHANGTDGSSIIDVALNWSPTIGKAEFLSVEAPFPATDGTGRQWFDGSDRSPDALRAGIQTAAPMLDAFLDELLAARKLDPTHLSLVGVGEGAMMALHVGLRREKQPGCILVYSGALYDIPDAAAEIRSKPPVLMIHGDAYEPVPLAAMQATKAFLKEQEVPVKSLTLKGLAAAIDDDGIIAASGFLTENVVHKSAKKEDDDHDHDHDDDHDHAHEDEHEHAH